MGTNNAMLSLIGWTFLPNLISSWIQKIYYGITIRAGTPHPYPGSARYMLHRRRIQILVVSLYLCYTIYEADHSIRQQGNYYSDLSLPFTATEKEIRSRMRRLAALHHPDKAGGNAQDAANSHNYFILLQRAAETLGDGAKRFAYERFGPDIHTWSPASAGAPGGPKLTTVRDYMTRGLSQKVPHYAATAGVLYLMSVFNYLSFARWWRWTLLALVCMAELWLVTRATIPPVLTNWVNPFLASLSRLAAFFVPAAAAAGPGPTGRGTAAAAATATAQVLHHHHHPPYLPFQLIQLLRQISLTSYIAFNQLGPLLRPQNDIPEEKQEEALQQGLDRLDGMVATVGTEAGRLVDLEMTPYIHDPDTLKALKGKVKDWLVQNTVRTDPMVRDAVGNELKKRRTGAPHGARGTT